MMIMMPSSIAGSSYYTTLWLIDIDRTTQLIANSYDAKKPTPSGARMSDHPSNVMSQSNDKGILMMIRMSWRRLEKSLFINNVHCQNDKHIRIKKCLTCPTHIDLCLLPLALHHPMLISSYRSNDGLAH